MESVLYTVVQSPLSGTLIDAHVTIQRYFPIANIQLINIISMGFISLLNIQMSHTYQATH